MAWKEKVTIGIPCLDEEMHIEATVRTALEQDYPRHLIEVLVADGGSVDGTLRTLGEMAQADDRLRVVPNPGKIQARGMNEIIRQARGDIIVRFDAHADYGRDYVKNCVQVLRETGADVVGGAQRPRATTPFEGALCAALTSPLGVGGAAYRSPEKEGWVDTVWLGAFRRSVFETAGLYDPDAITNEDAELNQRVLALGGGVYLSRKIVAHYYPRPSFRALARQYHRYGVGRARTLLKHGGFPTLRPLVPFGAVIAGSLMAITGSRWLGPCAALYLAATGIEAVRVSRKELASPWLVWAVFPVLHAAHGAGFAAGLLRYGGERQWKMPARLKPRPRLEQVA
jgi:glycosyltransferase involved in cell wall biosynthesis